VGLVHTQNFRLPIRKAHLGTTSDTRLSSGEQRNSHFKRVKSVHDRCSQPVDATLYLNGEMECVVMGQRFHRGFTAAEKTELWDRWKRGESLKAIGRAFAAA
jgi:hypothetical protein